MLPLRIPPDADLRRALEIACASSAAFVLSGIGSLTRAAIRLADEKQAQVLEGPLEILTLSGTLSRDGAHLHISVADRAGRVTGGHMGRGCVVRTTAEVLIAQLTGWTFMREPDPNTGFAELVTRREGAA